MKIRPIVVVVLGAAMLGALASAEQARCRGLDACERLDFEQTEKELAELVPQVLARVYEDSAPESQAVAKSALAEAQHHWIAFRDSTCKAEAAILFHRSARTNEGLTANCLLRMSKQRLDELKNYLAMGASR